MQSVLALRPLALFCNPSVCGPVVAGGDVRGRFDGVRRVARDAAGARRRKQHGSTWRRVHWERGADGKNARERERRRGGDDERQSEGGGARESAAGQNINDEAQLRLTPKAERCARPASR
eukprot:3823-Pleurochrysis_carterae.AAC.2